MLLFSFHKVNVNLRICFLMSLEFEAGLDSSERGIFTANKDAIGGRRGTNAAHTSKARFIPGKDTGGRSRRTYRLLSPTFSNEGF